MKNPVEGVDDDDDNDDGHDYLISVRVQHAGWVGKMWVCNILAAVDKLSLFPQVEKNVKYGLLQTLIYYKLGIIFCMTCHSVSLLRNQPQICVILMTYKCYHYHNVKDLK